jgi:hypothetical protein
MINEMNSISTGVPIYEDDTAMILISKKDIDECIKIKWTIMNKIGINQKNQH